MPSMYAVGGWVRDYILGHSSKDLDFTVVADSYEEFRDFVYSKCEKVFVETPEFYTIRGRNSLYGAVDFVWARKDGEYVDGRRPETVEPGTLMDDLNRRDFTVNALAVAEEDIGRFVADYPNRIDYVIASSTGVYDINRCLIKAVGNPERRFAEDGLRVLRGIRFARTKNMVIDPETEDAMYAPASMKAFRSVSAERVREEFEKIFSYDNSYETYDWLFRFYPRIMRTVIDTHGVWFQPSMKQN